MIKRFGMAACVSHIYRIIHICTHQTSELVFLLSRRSMNKTGVQRLSEGHSETWDVLADVSAAVVECVCRSLSLWTYSSSLDADCSENTHTPLLICLHKHAHTHTSADLHVQASTQAHIHTSSLSYLQTLHR